MSIHRPKERFLKILYGITLRKLCIFLGDLQHAGQVGVTKKSSQCTSHAPQREKPLHFGHSISVPLPTQANFLQKIKTSCSNWQIVKLAIEFAKHIYTSKGLKIFFNILENMPVWFLAGISWLGLFAKKLLHCVTRLRKTKTSCTCQCVSRIYKRRYNMLLSCRAKPTWCFPLLPVLMSNHLLAPVMDFTPLHKSGIDLVL